MLLATRLGVVSCHWYSVIIARIPGEEALAQVIGKRLGHYEILEQLGQGGMGVVYKARDAELGRLVALKSLPADRLADESRRARFLQEARSASALNHPNIVTIYEFFRDSSGDYLVMEYVDGQTLDRLIPRHGMPIAEALRLSIPMAEALAAAHKEGIVHRDLKPGNIMVSTQGHVKILDFGLAKLLEPGTPGETETTATMRPQTEEGVLMGTVSYMSPEQAEARPVDHRSDIFSFGAVLYEMLTGHRAFHGDSKMSTIASILREEPKRVAEVSTSVPRDVERIVHRCLRKPLDRRFQTMADLRAALLEVREESESGASTIAGGSPTPARSGLGARRFWLYGAAGIALAAAAGVFLSLGRNPPVEGGDPAGAAEGGAKVMPLTTYPGTELQPNLSPDGNQVAFSWNGEKSGNLDIYVKLLDGSRPLRLTSDAAEDNHPVWSPDGRQIAFHRSAPGSPSSVLVVPALGGPERRLTEGQFPAWTSDGSKLLFADRGSRGIKSISLASGEVKQLTSPPASMADTFPSASPDGKWICFVRRRGVPGDLILIPAGGGGTERILISGYQHNGRPAWLPDSSGVVIVPRVGNLGPLWRVPIGTGTGLATPSPISEAGNDCESVTVSQRSPARMVYSRLQTDRNIWRTRLDGGGADSKPLPFIVSTARDTDPQYSPDGSRVAFISYRSGSAQLWLADGEGRNERMLTSMLVRGMGPPRWSPDGTSILVAAHAPDSSQLHLVAADGGAARQLTSDATPKARPSFSRDGKWIYYASNVTGRHEVYRIPASGGSPVKVTQDGGYDPVESADGQTLYFSAAAAVVTSIARMPVAGGPVSTVIERARSGNWVLAGNGIYYNNSAEDGTSPALYHHSLQTGKTRKLADYPRLLMSGPGLSISTDERWALTALMEEPQADLMMLENFVAK